MTTPIINDVLLAKAQEVLENVYRLDLDSKFYTDVQKLLPRIFPAPDEVSMRPQDSEYDVLFTYVIQESEIAEALRVVLSLAFQANEWYGELVKDGGLFSIFTSCNLSEYTLLIKLVNVSLSDYEFNGVKDTGTRLLGPIKSKQFVPLDIKRPDATREVFEQRKKDITLTSYLSRLQSKILTLVGNNIPTHVPIPDEIIPAFGLAHDLNLVYQDDSNGKLRRKIDKRLGFSGWSLTVHKPTLTPVLSTIIDVQCDSLLVKVQATLLKPCLAKEKLILLGEINDMIFYRAYRPTDPDAKLLENV